VHSLLRIGALERLAWRCAIEESERRKSKRMEEKALFHNIA
jgi:hypothetical protein